MKRLFRINLLATVVLGLMFVVVVHIQARAQCLGDCPATNDGNVVLLPHMSDCTKYFECDWGIAIMHECNPGLHFNPILNVCDWPENAGCD